MFFHLSNCTYVFVLNCPQNYCFFSKYALKHDYLFSQFIFVAFSGMLYNSLMTSEYNFALQPQSHPNDAV